MLAALATVATGTIHGDGFMHTAEKIIRIELQCEADARAVVAPAFTPLKVDAHVVEHLLLVKNNGGREDVVAHYIRRSVHERCVGCGHQHANVMESIEDGLR